MPIQTINSAFPDGMVTASLDTAQGVCNVEDPIFQIYRWGYSDAVRGGLLFLHGDEAGAWRGVRRSRA